MANENFKNDVTYVAASESPFYWSSSSKCIINVAEVLERCKQYALITDGRILFDPDEA